MYIYVAYVQVTNQVFRFAKKAGASYINKPKMRHYVHCYALHCLDEEASNALRRGFKERGENVGAWRQACYKPLVAIAARQGWDIDAIFNAHPRLSVWYVPTKLRQLCHAERNHATASSSVPGGADHMPFWNTRRHQVHWLLYVLWDRESSRNPVVLNIVRGSLEENLYFYDCTKWWQSGHVNYSYCFVMFDIVL